MGLNQGQVIERNIRRPALDEASRRILALIQKDATISNAALAQKVSLSPATCWRRVRWLEQQGYIRYRATQLDAKRLGLGVMAFVDVALDKRDQSVDAEFREAVRQSPEVLGCFLVAGEADYKLRVVARDLQALSSFLMEKLTRLPGVSRIKTSVTLEEIKNTTELPLEHLE